MPVERRRVSLDRLRHQIQFLEGLVIEDAWQERSRKTPSNWRWNKAFMLNKAEFAERQGDSAEGRRLRETTAGIEENRGVGVKESL